MAGGIKASRKTPARPPKVSRKYKQALRVSPPCDYSDSQATEDEDWVENLRD